jgi:hypothetical protein
MGAWVCCGAAKAWFWPAGCLPVLWVVVWLVYAVFLFSFPVLGASKRANIVLNSWGFGGNYLVVILSPRVDFRYETWENERGPNWRGDLFPY